MLTMNLEIASMWLFTAKRDNICYMSLCLTLSVSVSLSGSSADQPQLITTAFEEGVENMGYFLSSWSVSIYERTGLRHRKG